MHHRPLLPLLLAALVGCATEDPTPVLLDVEAYLEQEVLLSVADNGDGVAFLEVEDAFGLEELDRNVDVQVGRYRVPEGRSVRDAVADLEQDHRVVFAEPNYIARISVNDPYVGYQWNLDQINVGTAWSYGTGSGIVVAVLDTGVKKNGPDGIAHILSGYDFYSNDSDPSDRNGHGTFVAGTIAQATNNGVGVAGIAPDVSILPVKVMSDQGYGDVNAIVNGITWATNEGAHVINMSLGTTASSRSIEQAVQYAHQNGVVVVAATGNEYASYLNYPAAYSTVLAVGASRYDGTRAGYSNYGTGIDLVAPGGDLSKDQNGDRYADGVLQETIEGGRWTYTFWEGTSMAAPHVAAAAALVMDQGVTDPDDVAHILTSTARDVGGAGWDVQYGYGLLDAGAAVQLAATGSYGGDTGSGDTGSGDTGSGDTGSGSTGTDTTAPTISGVGASTSGRQFSIYWTTNEAATSYVTFDGYGTYGNGDLTTAHTLTFTGSRGSTYTLTLESTDAAGNTATDGPYQLRL